MKIRKFRKQDSKEVSRIIRNYLKNFIGKGNFIKNIYFNYLYSKYSPDRLIGLSKVREIYVAESKGKVIGTASLRKNHIMAVYVIPKYQHHHLGTNLVKKLENITNKKGYKSVKLWSLISSGGFYKKLGYKKKFKFFVLILMKKRFG